MKLIVLKIPMQGACQAGGHLQGRRAAVEDGRLYLV
jgi:hypothetical protein